MVRHNPEPDSEYLARMAGLDSNHESQQLAEYLAELSNSGLPLHTGLRAAAVECGSMRLARELERLAGDVESGRSLEESLDDSKTSKQVAALIRAAERTPDFAGLVAGLLEALQTGRESRRAIRAAFIYPAIVLVLTFLVFAFFSIAVIPSIEKLLDESSLFFSYRSEELPQVTRSLFWMADTGIWMLWKFGAALVVIGMLVRRVAGAARWRRWLGLIPAVGPAWHWLNVGVMSRLLNVLLTRGLTLPDALVRTAEVIDDPYLAEICRRLAGETAAGRTLAQAMYDDKRLPQSLVPLLRWGEASNSLPDACADAARLMDQRVRMRVAWIRSVLPPVAFVVVALGVFSMYIGLLMPLINALDWYF